MDPTTIPVSEREGNQLAWSIKEFEHYGDVTNATPCRFCGLEFKGSVAHELKKTTPPPLGTYMTA